MYVYSKDSDSVWSKVSKMASQFFVIIKAPTGHDVTVGFFLENTKMSVSLER